LTRRTPAEVAAKLAEDAAKLARRLEAGEDAGRLFSREDVEALIESRLQRERKKRREVEGVAHELERENEALRREVGALS